VRDPLCVGPLARDYQYNAVLTTNGPTGQRANWKRTNLDPLSRR
jgi:hypothetical protein